MQTSRSGSPRPTSTGQTASRRGRELPSRGPLAGHTIRPEQEDESDEDDAEQAPFCEPGPPDERDRIGQPELVEDRDVLDDVGGPGRGGDERDARVKRERGRPPQPYVGGDE